jgi:hypothetical protein
MPSYGEFAALKSKTMTEIVKRFPRPNLIGAELFPENPLSSNVASWDVLSGTRSMARYVSTNAEAPVSELTARTRLSSELAFIKEKKTIDEATKNFIDKPGEFNVAYGEQAVADELEALDRKVENRREASRWLALTTGTLDINQSDPPVKFLIDYGMSATHKVTASTLWSDLANAKPFTNLMTWKKTIAQDSWITPTDVYMNSTTMAYLVGNTKEIQDLLKYTVGEQLMKNGYVANIAGMNIHVYDVSYKDKTNTIKFFIPDGKVIMVAKQGLGKTFVGPSEIPSDGGSSSKVIGKFAYSWVTKDPVDTWILTGVRELPVIQNPDQLLIATVA